MKTNLVILHTLSPLHAGIGQGIGVIDQPIAREKSTGIPYFPGSSLKGVLRSEFNGNDTDKKFIFGAESNSVDPSAGAVNFSDLRMLLFPVRSFKGVFAWVTSPFLLKRFERDLKNCGIEKQVNSSLPSNDQCFVSSSSELKINNQVILEEILMDIDEEKQRDVDQLSEVLAKIIFPSEEKWSTILKNKLVVVSDDVMKFILETCTEIQARIALEEEKKVVKDGALWYEETLPIETILSGLLIVDKTSKDFNIKQKISDSLGQVIQLGGNATVGQGLCELKIIDSTEFGG